MRHDDPTIHAATGPSPSPDTDDHLDMIVRPAEGDGWYASFTITFLNQSSTPTTVVPEVRYTEGQLCFRVEPWGLVTVPAGATTDLMVRVAPEVQPATRKPHSYEIEFRATVIGHKGISSLPLVQRLRFAYLPRPAVPCSQCWGGHRWPLWLPVSPVLLPLALLPLVLLAVVVISMVTLDHVPGRILTLPLVLVVPGYAVTAALFPKRALGAPERLVFSLGLSVAIVVLGGLLLNLTPFGLRASSWAVLLSGVTLGATVAARVRRQGQRLPASGWWRSGDLGLTFCQGLLVGLAAVVVCAAVAMSRISAARQPFPGFTQLWILPAGRAGATDAVRLGVRNMEVSAMRYRLAVSADSKVVKAWPSLDLKPHETWQARLVLLQLGHRRTTRVEAMLYRAKAPTTTYRHVVLWLDT